MMRLFSVPADFRESTIDRYRELNERYENAMVEETYGQATVGTPYGSGRAAAILPKLDLKRLGEYIAYSAERGIVFSYTFNPSCWGNREFSREGFRYTNRFLSQLWDIGVRYVTVSMPQLMMIIRESGYPFVVKASTICQVNNPQKAAFWRKQGITRMVVDEDDTIRDFRRIRRIVETFGDGVEVMVNSACVRHCPYRMFHYNHESHFSPSQDVTNFIGWSCAMQKTDKWSNPMRLNFVRPEDLHYYEDCGVSRFKLQGRHQVLKGDPVRAVEAYMKGSYEGNLYSLLNIFEPDDEKRGHHPYIENSALNGFLEPFFRNPDHCTGQCDKCGYCDSFAEKCMNRAAVQEQFADVQSRLTANKPFDVLRQPAPAVLFARRVARKLFGVKI